MASETRAFTPTGLAPGLKHHMGSSAGQADLGSGWDKALSVRCALLGGLGFGLTDLAQRDPSVALESVIGVTSWLDMMVAKGDGEN